jgi:sporulation protein YlmC with PRC-barrel domain
MTLTDFHPGAAAYSADGVHVGQLHRVIVDAESLDLHELIVQETRRFAGHVFAPGTALITDDVIVPLDAVKQAAHDRVDLTLTAAEVRRLRPYLSYAYAPLTSRDVWRMVVAEVGQTAYIPPVIETAAKADSEMEIEAGENIMLGHTGRKLGTVKDIIFDGREFVGVVMHPAGFFTEDVILQVRFLERSDDAALFARLSEDDVRHLQPFHPDDTLP